MSVVARRYFLRGRTALERGEWEPAKDAFRSAVELAPDFAMARVGYAIAMANEGDSPRAAQSLRAGLARYTSAVTRAAMWATLGDILTRSGDFLGAEDAFKQAAHTPGYEVRAASGLARVYGKTGRYAEAVSQLSRAARLSAAGAPQSDGS